MTDLSQWSVLLVDDEPDNIGVVEYIFRFSNVRVRSAMSVSSGIEMLQAELPTVLLTDVRMARMSGEDLLKVIRANDAWKHLKVIAITAYALEGDRERFLGMGFDGYISKPITIGTLIGDVQRVVESKGTQKEM